MKDHTHEELKISAAAERRMREWELTQQIGERTHRMDPAHPQGRQVGPYISISRETGAGGGEVAQMLGQKLGWEVLDKNLVDYAAERFDLSRSMLELVDETASSWVYDILGAWIDRKIIPHEKYVVLLERLVRTAARQGNVVLVGRGAQFILPPDRGVRVRLIASERFRAERMARLLNCTADQARQHIFAVDRGRREFANRFFHHDITDPHLYDLVINSERFGLEATADLIADICCRRGLIPRP